MITAIAVLIAKMDFLLFEAMAEIGIQQVLAEINQPQIGEQTHEFSISFVRTNDSQGGRKGEIKTISKARKYSKDPNKKGQISPRTAHIKLRENATLLIDDLETGRPNHIKIYSIVGYNNHRVRH